MTPWELARDEAASEEYQSADRWQRKLSPDSLPTYAYGVEIGFKRGANFGRAYEAKRAEALVEALKSIAEKKNMTMLGDCCVEKTCRPAYDRAGQDMGCTHRYGVNRGYAECAGEALAALAAYSGDKHE